MEIALRIEEFVHECVLMHRVLRDRQPFTDMEYQLLEAHLQQLADELALKKSSQMPAHEQHERDAIHGLWRRAS